MEVTVKRVTDWERVADAARMTVHKEALGHEPSNKFKKSILMAEHTPIRLLEFDIVIKDVPYFVVMHLVRHNQGIEKFVATSREDRTGVKREERRQTDLVDCMFSCNAQALINISHRRLCMKADPDTIKVWAKIRDKVEEIEPILAKFMVSQCVYRDLCPEMTSCGYINSSAYATERYNYQQMACK